MGSDRGEGSIVQRASTTRRRGLVGGLTALVAAVVLAGCIPTPPPVSLPAPTIISAEVTPVVVAGQSLTTVLHTFHPVGVTGLTFRVQAANGASFWSTESPSERPDECRSRDAVWAPAEAVAGAEAEVSGSCTMPTYSINGTWILTATVGVSGYQSTTVTVPFEVVGGIDDPGIYDGMYHPLADVLGRTTQIEPEVVVIAP